ncbi:DEAD/DEAH box helicase [Oxyplasma meridianum]|uniref:DEAD/DEAH box helicase n=1 Tax=Oxyplasma meridianum TaxID=3073602 RepID=A0AAX4NDK5_9ARCH
MIKKTFIFQPQYLPLTNNMQLGFRLHEFQVIVKDILGMSEDCLFLDAPTASGKTLSFILPSACNNLTLRRAKTLVISPTNLLISQTYEEISELIREKPEIQDMRLSRINSRSFVGLKIYERAKKIRGEFINNDIVISNPDVIALFLSGFYDKSYKNGPGAEFTRVRSTTDIFSELDIIIFDEYHVYSEEELGKISAFLNLCKLTGKVPKIIFTSATPQYKMREMLITLGFTYRDYHVNVSQVESADARCIRGEIKLSVTDQPIKDSLSDAFINEGKVLYLFDHKIEAEKARSKLIEMGLESKYIKDLSGFSNRALEKKESSALERCIVATNAAEQGLNLDVSIAHIEPGLYIENLTQRYGRIGRRGQPGSIFIHLKDWQVDKVSDHLADFSDLINELEKIFFSKDLFMSRIKRHFAAFMALCSIEDKRGIIASQIKNSVEKINDSTITKIYRAIIAFEDAIKKLSKLKQPNPEDIKDLNKWWDSFLLSIGFFRGESTSVFIRLKRDGEYMDTTEDIVWVKKMCITETIKDEKHKLYLISSFKEVPSLVELEFRLPLGTLRVTERELFDRKGFATSYCKKISSYLLDVFEGYGIDISEMTTNFRQLVEIIYPNMLMPKEVELASESQII